MKKRHCKVCGADITKEPNAIRIDEPDSKMAVAKPSVTRKRGATPVFTDICWECMFVMLRSELEGRSLI